MSLLGAVMFFFAKLIAQLWEVFYTYFVLGAWSNMLLKSSRSEM